MKQILGSANLATKFQILADVASSQPDIQQRDIARRLGLSPQAVSDYVKELLNDGWLSSEGRSKYRVTREGVDWMLKALREWQSYSDSVQKALAGISVCAAVADSDISEGQRTGLVMKKGLLYAVADTGTSATAEAVSAARRGEDVGVTNIDGIVPLDVGKITVVRVPAIQRGGSRQADPATLKKAVSGKDMIGAIGIEALTSLRKLNVEPTCLYGVAEALVEAARSGLSPVVVCADADAADLLSRLEANRIEYDILDARKADGT
jgi:putative transcriptional regulator